MNSNLTVVSTGSLNEMKNKVIFTKYSMMYIYMYIHENLTGE